MPTGVLCALPAIWASSPGRRPLDFHSPEPFHRESLDETDEGTQREPSHELRALRNYPKTVMKYFTDLVLCHSDPAGEGGDTRTGRRPTGSTPGSSRPSCRSAPGSPGTCTARPASARPPTAVACDLSGARCAASPSGPAP